ncbi:MAG: response regulator transcription factor [Bacteroidota bacterium]
MMAQRVLIVEDESTLAEAVAYSLGREGFTVSSANDGLAALKAFEEQHPDLVILDLMLPSINGWELFKAFRKQQPNVPVIMLTARADEADRVAGLEMGADDYVTKPFSMRELVARVRAVLRRLAAALEAEDASVIEKSGIRLDVDRHEVTVNQQVAPLSPKEFALLAYMMRHSGRVRTREEILHTVWGEDNLLDERTVDVHIRWLRMKIEQDPAHPKVLLTVRGVGYKFVDLS